MSYLKDIRTRDELPLRERAVSDALDECLTRFHGIFSGWVHPVEFLEFLEKRGYTVVEAMEAERIE